MHIDNLTIESSLPWTKRFPVTYCRFLLEGGGGYMCITRFHHKAKTRTHNLIQCFLHVQKHYIMLTEEFRYIDSRCMTEINWSTLVQNLFLNWVYDTLVCLFNTLAIFYRILSLCQINQIVNGFNFGEKNQP